MKRAVLFALAGYLSGSVLFARLAARLFHKPDLFAQSGDQNPGAFNAFQGGFFCGSLALCGDLLKGFLPVFAYRSGGGAEQPLLLALVLAAPVMGHILPLFFRFRGGKGVAVTFGCLLGLLPMWQPVILFAAAFLFFSLILRVTSHFYRTGVTYLVTALSFALLDLDRGVLLGFCLIACAVLLRLHLSEEARDKLEVKWLWKR